MENPELKYLVSLLEERNKALVESERDLADQKEELQAQKEELTAAIEEVVSKNASLEHALTKLRQRNEELDHILYRTSHDLKSPVTSLQGLLELLKGEQLTPGQQSIHTYMEHAVSQMNNVLRSLTMLADASFQILSLKTLNIEELINDVVQECKQKLRVNNLSVTVLNKCPCILADVHLLTIILRCLVLNAMTFRDPRGDGKISILADKNDNDLLIEVMDDGEGIDPEISHRVFEMFFRGSQRSQGVGLGLYIAKIAVDRCNGSIEWNSTVGKGSTFRVVLPLKDSTM